MAFIYNAYNHYAVSQSEGNIREYFIERRDTISLNKLLHGLVLLKRILLFRDHPLSLFDEIFNILMPSVHNYKFVDDDFYGGEKYKFLVKEYNNLNNIRRTLVED